MGCPVKPILSPAEPHSFQRNPLVLPWLQAITGGTSTNLSNIRAVPESVTPSPNPRQSREGSQKKRRRRWIVMSVIVVALIAGSAMAYHLVKTHRADRFAAAGDALLAEDSW